MPPCTSGEIRWWIFLAEGLFFRLLLYSSLETLRHAVGNPTHQVKGMLGGSVLFPANVSQGITVEKMEWDFRPQKRDLGYWLGEFSHRNRDHPSPTGRFGQRLDMVDETTLRIKDLELDDGGIYNTRIWFNKTQFQEQRFNLTVYEPVPTPQIHHQVESKTLDGCNVTLRCHTPGRKDLIISWETGGPHRALGKSVNQYQVSAPSAPSFSCGADPHFYLPQLGEARGVLWAGLGFSKEGSSSVGSTGTAEESCGPQKPWWTLVPSAQWGISGQRKEGERDCPQNAQRTISAAHRQSFLHLIDICPSIPRYLDALNCHPMPSNRHTC